jgi:hypothetical protein
MATAKIHPGMFECIVARYRKRASCLAGWKAVPSYTIAKDERYYLSMALLPKLWQTDIMWS